MSSQASSLLSKSKRPGTANYNYLTVTLAKAVRFQHNRLYFSSDCIAFVAASAVLLREKNHTRGFYLSITAKLVTNLRFLIGANF